MSTNLFKTPDNITTYITPKPKDIIPLIGRLNNGGESMCYPNISPPVLLKTMMKASLLIYAWSSAVNEPAMSEKTVEAILVSSDANPLGLKKNIYIEAICTRVQGYGRALFEHFLGLVKDEFSTISLQTANGFLVKVYKKWGFVQAFDNCDGDSSQCFMVYTIKK